MATLTAHADLPVGDHTVRDARDIALATAAAWQCEVSTETLLLLVDELAGAVREHASGEHSLLLEMHVHDGQGLRITLADGAAARATAADLVAGTPALAGLLESLAARWGDEPYQGGYSVWFDLGPEGPEPQGRPSRPDEPDVEVEVEVEEHLRRHRAAGPTARPALDAPTTARLDAWFARSADV
jgi:hypothetical protein